MADPLSITAGIVALIHASFKVTVLIKQFRNESSTVDATLTGLLSDVEGLKRVLESMRETVDQSDIKSNLQSTGHAGSHWKNLARSLSDGTDTLQKLHDLLDSISKKTSVLDTPRKLLRLKSASEQIAHYREQIQSSHTALQLSLSTIILWNQVTFQKSTERIPNQIVPTLNKLYEEFRTFGALLNAKIEKLQHAAVDATEIDNHGLQYMNNIRECVRSAADVVSSASTTLNADSSDKASVRYGSDFGDVFARDANEPMLRWFASNTVHEYDDVEAPLPAPSEASTGDASAEYHSDTDSDLENDLIRSLFEEGKKRKEQNDFTGAVRHFRNCLTRFSSKNSYAALTAAQSLTICGISKAELLEHLTQSYCQLGWWDKAKPTMVEKLSITERQVGRKDARYLNDTMKLAEIMMNNQDYVEAHLQARQSLQGFKKLGEREQTGYEYCLAFLIRICELEGKDNDREAYTALLAAHARGPLLKVPKFQSSTRSLDPLRPRSLSTPDLRAESIVETGVSTESQDVPLHPYGTSKGDFSHTNLHAASSSLERRLSVTNLDDGSKIKEPNAPKPSLPTLGIVKDMAASTSVAVDTLDHVQNHRKNSPLSPPIDGKSSDEEVYVLYLNEDHVTALDDIPLHQAPGITVAQPGRNTTALRNVPNTVISDVSCTERSRLRRYTSDSSIATEQEIGPVFLTEPFAALTVGETSQRAATSLSKLPSKSQESYPSGLSIDTGYAPSDPHAETAKKGSSASPRISCCPICNDALSEVMYNALSHVNKCIAEQRGITGVSQRTQDGQIQSSGALVSRQSSCSTIRTPTEGLWACNRCKPDTLQYLSEERCRFCSEARDINAPSSLNGFRREMLDYYQHPQTSRFLTPPRNAAKYSIRRKIVLLGDTLCGKTYLASTWSKGQHPSDSEDTVMNNFIKRIETEGCEVELVIWDCNGTDENETTRRLSYDNTNMVLICFDISDPDSFANVGYMWKAEAEKYLHDVPKVLVGCKKDLRDDVQKLQTLLLSRNILPISPYAGNNLAIRMCALAYFETSAIDRQGLSDLFDYVGKALLRAPLYLRNRGLQAPLLKGRHRWRP